MVLNSRNSGLGDSGLQAQGDTGAGHSGLKDGWLYTRTYWVSSHESSTFTRTERIGTRSPPLGKEELSEREAMILPFIKLIGGDLAHTTT